MVCNTVAVSSFSPTSCLKAAASIKKSAISCRASLSKRVHSRRRAAVRRSMIPCCGSIVASLFHKSNSPSKSKATVSNPEKTCRFLRASIAVHDSGSCPPVKLNTGIIGLAHHDRIISSSRYLSRTGSRASITYNAASLCKSCRSTLASWLKS